MLTLRFPEDIFLTQYKKLSGVVNILLIFSVVSMYISICIFNLYISTYKHVPDPFWMITWLSVLYLCSQVTPVDISSSSYGKRVNSLQVYNNHIPADVQLSVNITFLKETGYNQKNTRNEGIFEFATCSWRRI